MVCNERKIHIGGIVKLFRLFKHKHGQGMVEFALIIPIALMMMYGVIEGARLLFIYASVTSASREAARYGAAFEHYTDCGGILDAAKKMGFIAGISDSNITIKYDYPEPYTNNILVTKTGCPPPMAILPGSRILVDVKFPYTPIVPLVKIPNWTIDSQNSHTIVIGIQAPTVAPGP